MNLRRIRIYFKNALLIVLSVIVLASVTGLSYKAHYCNGNLSGIAFFTELGLQKPASCGCMEDLSLSKTHSSHAGPVALNKNSCCSNISFFGKLNIESPTNNFSTVAPVQPAALAVICFIPHPLTSVKEDISISDLRFRPPPLAGRMLVLFLSQQRIPLISLNC